MTTTSDIANMALVTIGLQKKISALTQDSAEAQTINQVFALVQNWCFGIVNWNFARNTASLTLAKGPPPASPGAWSSTYPTPPWLYEYTLPSDFIRAIYITNNTDAAVVGYLGEPVRFSMAIDTISSVQQEVLLTNSASCLLVYTALIASPTVWPFHFMTVVVLALARKVCLALTGSLSLYQELTQAFEQQLDIAIQINTMEGLMIDDNTPEWVQAIGINYPYRRIDAKPELQIPPTSISRKSRGNDQSR